MTEPIKIIGGEESPVRGVLVDAPYNTGDQEANAAAEQLVQAANTLHGLGHTMLQFVPFEAKGNSGNDAWHTLVIGQRPELG